MNERPLCVELVKSALYGPGAHDLWDIIIDGQTALEREPRAVALAVQNTIPHKAADFDHAVALARTIAREMAAAEQAKLKAFFQARRAADKPR